MRFSRRLTKRGDLVDEEGDATVEGVEGVPHPARRRPVVEPVGDAAEATAAAAVVAVGATIVSRDH